MSDQPRESGTDPANIPERAVVRHRRMVEAGGDTRVAIATALDALFDDEPVMVPKAPSTKAEYAYVRPCDMLAAVLRRVTNA